MKEAQGSHVPKHFVTVILVDGRLSAGGARVVVLFAATLLMAVACHARIDTEKTGRHLIDMHNQPYFWEVMFGSVIGWILGMVKGFSSAKDWLESYWPTAPRLVLFLLDLIIFVACGAYIGTGIYNPVTLHEALAAGVSWPVGFGALATKD